MFPDLLPHSLIAMIPTLVSFITFITDEMSARSVLRSKKVINHVFSAIACADQKGIKKHQSRIKVNLNWKIRESEIKWEVSDKICIDPARISMRERDTGVTEREFLTR